MADSDGILASPFATLRAVRARATEAVIGQIGLTHPALASAIRSAFGSTRLEDGALVGEPVVEAAFPYLQGEHTLEELSGSLLHPRVFAALTGDDPERSYAFAKDLKPYRHQIEAWRVLRDPDPRSVLVTSGTGSGKTECFLIPLLDDLAREAEGAGRLAGVRAIALYPLNALIASQEERLREWTAPFGGRLRFGLYNGNMPEDAKERTHPPEQVVDRRTLRADPPPILVTNVTMLEYMTVRRQDQALIERSRGKLRWIILDEAHSYIGSSAAEIALLIRRVLLAFGVTPEQVRFVATSATIGEGDLAADRLRRFLADVSGAGLERVHVVVGRRRIPALPTKVVEPVLADADLGEATALGRNPVVHGLVEKLDAAPLAWAEFAKAVAPTRCDPEKVAWALARPAAGGEPIAPLRVHGFLRAVPGLWACLDPLCPGRPEGEWPFGAVLSRQSETCPWCSALVLEIAACAECGEPVLTAVERDGRLRQRPCQPEFDEFAAGSESEEDGSEADDDAGDVAVPQPEIGRLLATRDLPGGRPMHVAWRTGIVCDVPDQATSTFQAHERTCPETCPACGEHARQGSEAGTLMRPFRYGAPFLIGNAAPILLDGVEPVPRRPDPAAFAPPPHGGRQLLSFTDSRQSTARFAAALQSASERNQVRALIYHAVQDTLQVQPGATEKVAELDRKIADLESAAKQFPALAGMLAEERAKRAELAAPAPDGIPWTTLRGQLASNASVEWIRRVWSPRDRPRFEDPGTFAEFLLLRELARRPRKANSVETLGLARLRFEHVDRLPEGRLPPSLRDRGRTLSHWRDFLTLLLTVNVRNAFAIRMDRADVHWLIRRGFPRILLAPNRRKEFAKELAWPVARAAGRPAIVVRLLERMLGLDVGDGRDRAELNAVLECAWDCLRPLFTQPGAGEQYALDLALAHVAPVPAAYLCPVSRRVIDTTMDGISPYGLDGSSRLAGSVCERLAMPVHPNPHLLHERGGSAVVEAWLESDPAVATLRARGLWNNLHDRIASGSPYSRAAEHSAQQPPGRLRRYEAEFKAGRINVLNCSTTMEMGVDIGSVQSVMMTNVPPSIANYRQRVGRAGRRGQGFATSLTYARDTPLDREVFRDPAGYLRRRLEAPRVSLDSRRIVQRHVNALLLATWFKEAGGEALKAKAGDFFGCPATVGAGRSDEPPSLQARAWIMRPSTATSTTPALDVLVRGSILAGDPRLHARACEALNTAEEAFLREWEAIQAQTKSMDRESARKSLGFQLTRLCGEHLLGDLADRGVLPGHGFPTAVVSFVHTQETDRDEATPDGEGSPWRRRSFPSRNLDIAIRDYAPGGEVVVDGLVYRSAGLTLNWRRPAGEEGVREIQSLKWFWSCTRCGAADTTRLVPDHCTACGADLDSGGVQRFLEPAGFTVDDREKPHAEIERVSYVEPEPERVSARGAPWRPFLEPARGRLRAASDGLVFFASRGAAKRGYAVCLECGRAEAEGQSGSDEAPLHEHKPLRFTKGDAEGRCRGNDRSFAIQTGLAFGHDIATDVAEVEPHALSDRNAAWALASALRTALARRLGIDPGEMGLAVAPRINAIGGRTHALYLFDRAAGGAGYALRSLDLFDDLLEDVRAILECPNKGCVRGCSACVLTSDLFAQAETIDRKAALAFVAEELASIETLAPADAVAPGARRARDAADELVSLDEAGCVTIWPAGPLDPAAFSLDRMRALLQRLQDNGRAVVLCLAASDLASLDDAGRLSLRDVAIRFGIGLATGQAPTFGGGARAVATTAAGHVLASRDERACELGEWWGIGRAAPLVMARGPSPAASPVVLDSLLPKPGAKVVEVGARLDGSSRGFGRRFVDLLRPALEAIGLWLPGRLQEMRYTDRYVCSPLTTRLVVGALSALSERLAPPGRRTDVRIETQPLRPADDRIPFRIEHDWRSESDRREVLVRLGSATGIGMDLHVGPCAHSRRIELRFENGAASVILDQGFGFLRPTSPRRYDFGADAKGQAGTVNDMATHCTAVGSTYLVVSRI